MDRGAARSRKRSQVASGPINLGEAGPSSRDLRNERSTGSNGEPNKDGIHPSRQGKPNAYVDAGHGGSERYGKRQRPAKQLIDEATRYKPKAIRSSAALIWSQAPFALPPPKDVLEGVRRVDLAGSGVTDLSWLKGSGVTWLSLAGCEIKDGWDAVGSLQDLSVLNISNCGLTELPPALAGLVHLKALVAMGNNWTRLADDVVTSWKELNSLIVSHSPSLDSLPVYLNRLYHLSKLTFSHCPQLSAASLPNLSTLPLLRDVKMNNLPLLTSLPPHIATWGTGDLSLSRRARDPAGEDQTGESSVKRYGEGLEVLDLGNCSLPFSAIDPVFIKSKSQNQSKTNISSLHLRSLSLHSNPLCTTHPDYAELLQASPNLPNLQIIDAKRVKERKRKGEVSESRKERVAREKRSEKMKPSGANVGGNREMRQWGGDAKAEGEEGERKGPAEMEAKTSKASRQTRGVVEGGRIGDSGASDRKKRREGDRPRSTEEDIQASKASKKRKAGEDEDSARDRSTKSHRSGGDDERRDARASRSEKTFKSVAPSARVPPPPAPDLAADPSLAVPAPQPKQNHKQVKEPVYQVVQVPKTQIDKAEKKVKKKKGSQGVAAAQERPLDLQSMFGTKAGGGDQADDGLGLGVSGW